MHIRPAALVAGVLLLLMFFLAGGAALRESVTIDEVAHIGAGLSYVEKQDLRFNDEHPPLAKLLAGLSLAMRGTRADYSSPQWTIGKSFFPAYMGEWVFGGLGREPLEQSGEYAGVGAVSHAAVDAVVGLGGLRARAPPGWRLGRSALRRWRCG